MAIENKIASFNYIKDNFYDELFESSNYLNLYDNLINSSNKLIEFNDISCLLKGYKLNNKELLSDSYIYLNNNNYYIKNGNDSIELADSSHLLIKEEDIYENIGTSSNIYYQIQVHYELDSSKNNYLNKRVYTTNSSLLDYAETYMNKMLSYSNDALSKLDENSKEYQQLEYIYNNSFITLNEQDNDIINNIVFYPILINKNDLENNKLNFLISKDLDENKFIKSFIIDDEYSRYVINQDQEKILDILNSYSENHEFYIDEFPYEKLTDKILEKTKELSDYVYINNSQYSNLETKTYNFKKLLQYNEEEQDFDIIDFKISDIRNSNNIILIVAIQYNYLNNNIDSSIIYPVASGDQSRNPNQIIVNPTSLNSIWYAIKEKVLDTLISNPDNIQRDSIIPYKIVYENNRTFTKNINISKYLDISSAKLLFLAIQQLTYPKKYLDYTIYNPLYILNNGGNEMDFNLYSSSDIDDYVLYTDSSYNYLEAYSLKPIYVNINNNLDISSNLNSSLFLDEYFYSLPIYDNSTSELYIDSIQFIDIDYNYYKVPYYINYKEIKKYNSKSNPDEYAIPYGYLEYYDTEYYSVLTENIQNKLFNDTYFGKLYNDYQQYLNWYYSNLESSIGEESLFS